MKVNDLLKKSCRIVKSALFFRLPKIPSAVCAGLIPPLTYYLCELYYHNPFETPLSLQIIGWLPYYLTAALIFGCCGRASIALAVSTSLHTVIALINSYVIIFRGSPILPWDILSVRTAVSVADGFDFTPDARTLICSVLLLVLIFISAHTELRIRGAKLRVPTALMSAALFCGFALSMQSDKIGDAIGLYEMPFTQKYTYRQNGFWPSFFMNAKYLVVDVPEGYSEDEVRSIEAKLPEAEQTSGGTPNIVVVVDEAFSDLSVLGHFETNIEVMPFYKSLVGSENTVTGVSYTSILGGNTANTEFEFLTGDTMAFLPSGSIPYQQYINEATSALPRAMTAYGYASTFIHPYGAAGWNRNIVCPYLGFQTCLFDTDLKYGRYIRNRISDKSVCDYIFDAYENKEDGTPTFIYALTMQNHSGYSTKYANFSPYVHVLGFENDQIYSAETYLTLIRETDNALRKLINYFSTVDEDTVVIFFGDHQ
ncbi:MAG: LTA synthase family protein, partial [Eubacteriales bacterium]